MVWKPTSKAIKRKHDHIEKALYDAEAAKKDSFERLAEAEKKRLEAYIKAEEIVDSATNESYFHYDSIISLANKEAEKIKISASNEIETLKKKVVVDNNKHITEKALKIAEMLLKKNIGAEDNEKIIDSFLKKYEKENANK